MRVFIGHALGILFHRTRWGFTKLHISHRLLLVVRMQTYIQSLCFLIRMKMKKWFFGVVPFKSRVSMCCTEHTTVQTVLPWKNACCKNAKSCHAHGPTSLDRVISEKPHRWHSPLQVLHCRLETVCSPLLGNKRSPFIKGHFTDTFSKDIFTTYHICSLAAFPHCPNDIPSFQDDISLAAKNKCTLHSLCKARGRSK